MVEKSKASAAAAEPTLIGQDERDPVASAVEEVVTGARVVALQFKLDRQELTGAGGTALLRALVVAVDVLDQAEAQASS